MLFFGVLLLLAAALAAPRRHRATRLLGAPGGAGDMVDGLRVQKVAVPPLATLLNRDMFYYEVADWQWWDEVSEQGEANVATNPRATTAAAPAPAPAAAGVYRVGSFTYGAKLWPACLAVAQVRNPPTSSTMSIS
jgi:hypothetical protein